MGCSVGSKDGSNDADLRVMIIILPKITMKMVSNKIIYEDTLIFLYIFIIFY